MEHWDAAQYLKFKQQRTRPAIDLAARIPLEHPEKIADIGCGPGNSTAVLKQRFPGAKIVGADSSADMIAAAEQAHPEMQFIQCDAQTELEKLGQDYDVVFSNACLQWIPDHPVMIPKMLQMLRPGGVLAVQIPVNYEEPIHKIISRLIQSPQWKGYFHRPQAMYHLTPATYYDLLSESAAEFHMWQTTYFHHMPSQIGRAHV